MVDRDRLFSRPLRPENIWCGAREPDLPGIALPSGRYHRAGDGKMRCAGQKPHFVKLDSPCRWLPVKTTLELIEQNGFEIGIVRSKEARTKSKVAGSLRQCAVAAKTEAEPRRDRCVEIGTKIALTKRKRNLVAGQVLNREFEPALLAGRTARKARSGPAALGPKRSEREGRRGCSLVEDELDAIEDL